MDSNALLLMMLMLGSSKSSSTSSAELTETFLYTSDMMPAMMRTMLAMNSVNARNGREAREDEEAAQAAAALADRQALQLGEALGHLGTEHGAYLTATELERWPELATLLARLPGDVYDAIIKPA